MFASVSGLKRLFNFRILSYYTPAITFAIGLLTLSALAESARAQAISVSTKKEGTKLSGYIQNSTNRAERIKFAIVKLFRDSTYLISATTDSNGQFNFTSLAPGTYNLLLQHADYYCINRSTVYLMADYPTSIRLLMTPFQNNATTETERIKVGKFDEDKTTIDGKRIKNLGH